MSINQIPQPVLMALGFGVFLVIIWAVMVKLPQQRVMAMKPWADRRGLSFTPPVSLGGHTVGYEVTVLQGAVHGVPFALRSADLVNARRAAARGKTDIQCRSVAPVNANFSVSFEPGVSGPGPGAVFSGDRIFDAFVRTSSDNVAAAHAWLQMPQLREAVRSVVSDTGTVVVRYAAGEIAIQLSDEIGNEAQLDRALALIAACAHARLA